MRAIDCCYRGRTIAPLLLALLFAVLIAPRPAAAQSGDNPTGDVHTVSAVLTYGPIYPAGRWVPVTVTLENRTDAPAGGRVVVPLGGTPGDAAGDSAGAATYSAAVSVPARSRVTRTVPVFLPPVDDDPDARRAAREGRPLAVVVWEADDGRRLTRTNLVARADQLLPDADRAPGPAVVVLSVEADGAGERPDDPAARSDGRSGFPPVEVPPAVPAFGPSDLAERLGEIYDRRVLPATLTARSLPRDRAAYESVGLVHLALPPEDLDAAQRDALRRYVVEGGTLLLAAPAPPEPRGDEFDRRRPDPSSPRPADAADDWASSWLADWLPAVPVGRREAVEVAGPGGVVRLAGRVGTVQAVAAPGATVVAGDGEGSGGDGLVTAAVRRVGLGRVAFLASPVGAAERSADPSAEPADPRQGPVAALWRGLLGDDWSSPGGSMGVAAGERDGILQSMVGLTAPAWSLAALACAAYVGVVVAAHLAFRGAGRPRAFAASSLAAVVAAGGLLGLTAARSGGGDLTAARLAVVDLAPGGGGRRVESVALYGVDRPGLSLAVGGAGNAGDGDPLGSATLRPARADPSRPPTVAVEPFAAPDAGASAGAVDRVWQTTASVPASVELAAVASFGPDGLTLSIDNRAGGPLADPLLLWGGRAVALGPIPPGESVVGPEATRSANAAGDFSPRGVVSGEASKLRGRVAGAAEGSGGTTGAALGAGGVASRPPRLAGFLEEPAGAGLIGVAAAGGSGDGDRAAVRGQTLVRSAVRVEPSPVGSAVRVDPPFARLVTSGAQGGVSFYDPATGRWIDATQPGSWLVGFAPPPGIGAVRPTRVEVSADLDAALYAVSLRRGQVRGGSPEKNPAGPVVYEASGPSGRSAASADLEPGDYDAQGRVWLLLTVDALGPPGDLPPRWRVRSLGARIDGEVIAPPGGDAGGETEATGEGEANP